MQITNQFVAKLEIFLQRSLGKVSDVIILSFSNSTQLCMLVLCTRKWCALKPLCIYTFGFLLCAHTSARIEKFYISFLFSPLLASLKLWRCRSRFPKQLCLHCTRETLKICSYLGIGFYSKNILMKYR